ncbi:4-alpha-glucanotransferase [Anaeromassilibacillus sp. An200]|uniref:4-alpha-glucanotransferase n=1 Tax=Anaeromassilibacillus sp. An200 TaxID=1965587 RepID=UPI000B387B74|nr:4-alpha-glucanotransferase [Anaeromassilibacillus sp. An200]OUP12702.1 4-alpha-glucanotransferase [Anaeromassilibacillus sp. An200]
MKKQKVFPRSAGVLMPVFSLPSPYGIGTFGKAAYEFIDFLKDSGQTYWQVLPLGPTSYGDSPYQSFSAFAGNPYFIDLDFLLEEGLLEQSELDAVVWQENENDIDYAGLYEKRFPVLKLAFSRSSHADTEAYRNFCGENQEWLDSYAQYMSLKMHFGGKSWLEWPEPLRRRDPKALEEALAGLTEEVSFWKFCQFKFFEQWTRLREYAHKQGIGIIGDIPIYAAMDSADAWAEPEVFYLDENCRPIDVAGCPPDAFSATGQLWGNPLYRWDYQEKTGFAWWKRRLAATARLYDIVRIDHFRGLVGYYAIPAGDATAENGEWRKGPGLAFFEAVQSSLGGTQWILEDLGYLTPDVHRLRQQVGAPGMKVLQFAFDSREESDYLPHNYDANCVVYTGTHDNDTMVGWMHTAPKADVRFSRKYLNIRRAAKASWEYIRAAYLSVSALAVIPLQDFLGLGSEARINTPSTLGMNWRWRVSPGACTPELAEEIRDFTALYGRIPQPPKQKKAGSKKPD